MPTFDLAFLASQIKGKVVGSESTEVTALSVYAEQVVKGGLFVAIPGTKFDGHNFIEQAFFKGAAACVVEDESMLKSRAGIVVKSSRTALSTLASLFTEEPTKKVPIIGVTGTNGKTTTHWLIAHLLECLDVSSLRIGTIGIELEHHYKKPNALTTPGPQEIHSEIAEAIEKGAKAVAMEVSSHALSQGRVDDVVFDVGVFTNVSRDHLDYHESLDDYAYAKAKLFSLLGEKGKGAQTAVINLDDPHSAIMIKAAKKAKKILTYGTFPKADFFISQFTQSLQGSKFILIINQDRSYEVQSPFIGLYNAFNCTAAIAACVALGFSIEKTISLIPNLPQVSGRLEAVGTARKGVYVDYAHTPDALQNALTALRPLTKGKLWVLFGCGGDRDRGKRPQMALVATQYADKVVVTSDNPRTEDPQLIIDDILSAGIKPEIVEIDRKEAITKSLSLLENDDVLLIAGKGHENYQIIGTTKHPFSDTYIAKEFFQIGRYDI